MATLTVDTAQNVAVDYELASVGDRIAGVLIDYIIRVIYVILLFILLDELHAESTTSIILLVVIPVLLYRLVSEVMLDGQTLGKKLMRTRVLKLDGSQPTVSSYLLRWMLMTVDASFGGVIGMVSMASSDKGQRIGDILAGTTVIKTVRRVSLNDTLYANRANESYIPTYPAAMGLSERDVATIQKVLLYTRKRTDRKMLETMSTNVKKALNLTDNGSNEQFLKRVLKDYYYYLGGAESGK